METKEKEKLKYLYQKSIEKWENIQDLLLIGKEEEAENLCFSRCAFCEDAIKHSKQSFSHTNIFDCKSPCKINRKICGSPSSLLHNLEEAVEVAGEITDYDLVNEIVYALRREYEKL